MRQGFFSIVPPLSLITQALNSEGLVFISEVRVQVNKKTCPSMRSDIHHKSATLSFSWRCRKISTPATVATPEILSIYTNSESGSAPS